MNEKLNTRIEDKLLEARREGLKQIHETSMRPHGKLWGMDVFSWFNPTPDMVANTLHSFPFPVIWIGNGTDITQALTEEELVINNLRSVISYDTNVFNFKGTWLDGLKNCAGTSSVEEAFHFLRMFKAPQTVLMFTASGDNWEEQKVAFEKYLELVQV